MYLEDDELVNLDLACSDTLADIGQILVFSTTCKKTQAHIGAVVATMEVKFGRILLVMMRWMW